MWTGAKRAGKELFIDENGRTIGKLNCNSFDNDRFIFPSQMTASIAKSLKTPITWSNSQQGNWTQHLS